MTVRPGISPSGPAARAARAATSRVGVAVCSWRAAPSVQPAHRGGRGVAPGQRRGRPGRRRSARRPAPPPGRPGPPPRPGSAWSAGSWCRSPRAPGSGSRTAAAPPGRARWSARPGTAAPGRPSEAERDVHPAALAAGQAAQPGAGLLGQSHGGDQLVGIPRARGSSAPGAGAPRARSARRSRWPCCGHDADPGPPGPARPAPGRCPARPPRRRPGAGSRSRISTAVVLPAPLGPSRAKISPAPISRSSRLARPPRGSGAGRYTCGAPGTRTAGDVAVMI